MSNDVIVDIPQKISVVKASEFVKGIWCDWLLHPESTIYNTGYTCLFNADLDICRFQDALQQLVDKNINLRSSFYEKDGELFQKINKNYKADLQIREANSEHENDSVIAEIANKPFDLTKGPLFRYVIVKRDFDRKYAFVMFYHHIIVDGICYKNLLDELGELYCGGAGILSQEENISNYNDYLHWLSEKRDEQKNSLPEFYASMDKECFSYNVGKLVDGNNSCKFVNDGGIANSNRFNYSDFNMFSCGLPESANAKLSGFSKRNNISVFNILKTVWSLLMSRYASQNKISLSYAVSLRPKKYSAVKGYMVNIVIDKYHEQGSFYEQLNYSASRLRSVIKRDRFIPFHEVYNLLKNKIGTDTGHIFPQVGFTQIDFPEHRAGELDFIRGRLFSQAGEHRIMMQYYPAPDGVKFHIGYNKHFFDESTVADLLDNFNHLLRVLLDNPEIPTKDICVLDPEQSKKIVYKWNKTERDYPADNTIHQLFESQVDATPDNIALVYKDKRLTYRELDIEANRMAHGIRALYVERFGKDISANCLIGICMHRSPQLVIAILAILKAGAAYVPLDISEPKARIKKKIKDCGCAFVLTDSKTAKQLEGAVYDYRPENSSKPGDLAYVIYTSGSTGKPKGVMLEHTGVVNLVWDHKEKMGINSNSRVLQYASMCFDVSVSTLFSALLTGACAYLADEETRKDTRLLLDYIIENRINIINIPPVLLGLLEATKELVAVLETVIVGGEVCDKDSMERWAGKVNLINAYGPTEITVTSSYKSYKPGESSTNIGKPLSNKNYYILDANMNPVPVGVSGELYIGGVGVARGYLGRNKLTNNRFIRNPFIGKEDDGCVSSCENERVIEEDVNIAGGDVLDGYLTGNNMAGNLLMYKTGDICRWLTNGDVEFIGRSDNQIKIRGFRIEMGEVEACLSSFKQIQQAVVLHNNGYLVAYYVSESDVDKEMLRQYISESLPDYMVPSVFVPMDKFPLNSSGKIDRKILPKAGVSGDNNAYVTPVEYLDKKLCSLCEEILEIERVGLNDDFFLIGGSSIQALEFVLEVNKRWGINIPVSKLFLYSKLGELSEYLKREKSYHDLVYYNSDSSSGGLPNAEGLPKLYMTPLLGCGVETYFGLAEYLKDDFCCIGIENYNLYHSEQMDFHSLAEYYTDKIWEEEGAYILLGNSFGGQVALEMASVLEKRGAKNIKVVLLDTILFNRVYKIISDIEFWGMQKVVDVFGFVGIKGVGGFSLAEKLESFEKYVRKGIYYDFSRRLTHTNVILFNALKRYKKIETAEKKLADYKLFYWVKCVFIFVMKLFVNSNNNVDKIAPRIKKIELDCHHGEVITYRKEILEGIKSFNS